MKNGKPKSFSKRPGGKPDFRGDKKKPFVKKGFEKPRGDKARDEKPRGDRTEKRGDFKPAASKRGDFKRVDSRRDDFKRDDSKRTESKRGAVRFERKFEKPVREEREVKPVFEKRERAPRDSTPRLQGPLLWGFHAVRAAWLNDKRRVVRLMVTDAGLAGFQDTLDENNGLKRPKPEIMDRLVFDRLMPPGAVHQGVAALVESLPVRDAHDLIAGVPAGKQAIIVVLDQVTDPHNVGAILRSAAAFGAAGVIMQDRHTPDLTGVLAKAASGAADVIPVAVETNLSRAIELLQENDYFVIGLDERGDNIADLPKYDRLAIVLGAEGSGLRQNVANHCDGLVSLPTEGVIRSLNVSNAAAVALYAVKK